MPNAMVPIKSAGKALSRQRANQISEVFKAIANLLIETGSADVLALKEILDSLNLDAVAEPMESGQVEAGQLENVLEDNWERSLWNLLDSFRHKFCNLFDSFTPELRQPLVGSLISELAIALTSHAQGYPEETHPIQASVAVIPFEIKPVKRVRVQTAEGYKRGVSFIGVLARIDEVSEGIPAVGTGQPLFLPLATAQKVVAQVKASPGMFPIDADISLSRHADENIIGTITDAQVAGQDLTVSGYLFHKNVPNQVNQILKVRNPLGMSMNAMVSGYQVEMEDQTVFYLQDVDLQGANVLFADRATYKQTRFTPIAANQSQPRRTPVAANKLIEETSMDPLEEKLEKLEQLLLASQQDFVTQLAASQAENESLKARMEAIEAEKLQKEQQQQAQLVAAAEESKAQALVEKVTAGVLDAINPRRQVPSMTSSSPLIPVAAQGQQVEADPILKEIELIDMQLRILQANDSMGNVGAIALIERKRQLQLQLG
jgi:hypothetical protein